MESLGRERNEVVGPEYLSARAIAAEVNKGLRGNFCNHNDVLNAIESGIDALREAGEEDPEMKVAVGESDADSEKSTVLFESTFANKIAADLIASAKQDNVEAA